MNTLSVIIPVWNEQHTLAEIIRRVETVSVSGWHIEIIIVDDASTDDTRELLKSYETKHTIIYHQQNLGKGSAVTTGIARATGQYIIIQDADLEYDPADIPKLLPLASSTSAVYGSRNISPMRRGGLIPRLGVAFLTFEFNLLFDTQVTDIWTCYKLFPKSAAHLFTAGRFESELSFSAKLIKHGYSIIEIPIHYYPRQANQGKKIRYRDGLLGIWILLKDRFS